MPAPAVSNLLVLGVVLALIVFPLIFFISRQPMTPNTDSPDVNEKDSYTAVPASPWLHFLTVSVQFSVLLTLMEHVWPEATLWALLGGY